MVFKLVPEDGASFEFHGHERLSRFLVVCEHASNRVPVCLGDMGIAASEFMRHIAYDIGAAGVSKALADLLGAPALLAGFSRLVVDLNRFLSDDTLIPPHSDGANIPVNQTVTETGRAGRLHMLYHPFHQALEQTLSGVAARGEVPVLLNIHSFTPQLQAGAPRPWHVGVLWNKDQRLSHPLMAQLRARGDCVVGDNEPYSRHAHESYTVDYHAEIKGYPNLMVEIRHDLIQTPAQQKLWAQRIFHALPQQF